MTNAVSGAAQILQRHFQRMQGELVREEVKAMAPAALSPVLLEAAVQYVASALFGLLAWWIDGKRRMTVDEVNDLFRDGAPRGQGRDPLDSRPCIPKRSNSFVTATTT